jgi:hypothetical protein
MTTIRPKVGTNRTYVDSDKPTTRNRTTAKGYVRGPDDEFSLVQIGLGSAAVDGVRLSAAQLRVPLLEAIGGGSRNFYADRLDLSFNVRKVKYANQPDVVAGSTSPALAVGAVDAGYMLVLDVLTDTQAFLDAGLRAHPGWRISTDDTNRRKLDLTKAELRLVYTTAPGVPTGLKPNGQLVSVSKFTVGWQATLDWTSFQVQVGPSGFASPTLDTGWFDRTPATQHVLDLATTTYGGLTSGSTYFRVKARNAAGQESDWSQEALVPRGTKAGVTVAQPGPVVLEPTPPHDVDSVGMVGMRITVDDLDAGKQVLDTDDLPSTDGQFTPDTPVYSTPGHHYRGHVTVWDGQDWSPYDPPATATFDTVAELTGLTAPVDTIVAEQEGDDPWVLLTFTRSVMPDGFRVMRNGVDVTGRLVESGVFDAPDVHVSGTTYQVRDYTAPGFTDLEYQVLPVDDNGTADTGPKTTVVLAVYGLWVVHPATQRRFCLSGESGPVVLTPTGTDEFTELRVEDTITRRVSSVVGPVTGNAQGVIADEHDTGRSIAEQEADLWAMRGMPTSTVFRLTQALTNAPVTVGDLIAYDSETTMPERDDTRRAARFTCTQAGELPFIRPAV